MRIRKPLAAIVLVAVAALVTNIGSAHANVGLELSGSSSQTLSGRVTLQSELAEVICDTTLVAAMERATEKVAEEDIGRTTEVRTASCRSSVGTFRAISFLGVGSATSLWTLLYQSFLGTLPTVTGIAVTLEQIQALVELSVFATSSCLYAGNVGLLATVEGRGSLERLRTSGRTEVALSRTLAGICPESGRFVADLRWVAPPRLVLLRAAPAGEVSYEPRPLVEIANGAMEANATLRNDYAIRDVREIAVRDEAGAERKYRAGIGSCMGVTLRPRGTCVIEVRRAERRKRGLGNVIVEYRVGRRAVLRSTTVQVEGRGEG
jgi:hypothetical protein